MKIAVIAKTRLPIVEPFAGGLEAFTHTICKEYIRQGHDVTLYAHAGSDRTLNLKSFYGDEHRDDENFDLYENDEYVSILKDIERNDFDVVHNNSTHELPILWGMTSKIPVVTTIHTPPISKLKAAITIASDSSNLHFVLISKSFQMTWKPYMSSGSTIIYNGIDMNKWSVYRKGKQYLLWFGRIVHTKGLDIALDAAHKAGYPLRFAGQLDDTKYFEEQIKPRMKDSDVYLGQLNQTKLLAQTQDAAAAISSVRWEEPFGLSTVEAMAAGVPVAGFDRGAFREIVGIQGGAIAKHTDVESLAEAIAQATELESSDVRKQAEHFSINRMVKEYSNLFEAIK